MFYIPFSRIYTDLVEDTPIITTHYIQKTNLENNNYNTFNGDCSTDDDRLENMDDSNLNYYQKEVIEWMIITESQEPYGGIIGKYEFVYSITVIIWTYKNCNFIATDMGTVDYKMSIIMGLLLKSKVPNMNNTRSEGETDLDETIHEGHTLLICSDKTELDKWIKCIPRNNILNVFIYYRRYREMSLKR